MTEATVPPARRLRRRRLAAGAVLVVVAATILVATSGGHRPTSTKLPDPNGFDDLTRAGSLIKGTWPNKGDVDRADPATLRPFVEANRAALALARVGLGRESVAHFPDTQEGLSDQIDAQQRVKDVARLLAAEGLVAASDGRFGDASRSFRDAMNAGQALTQGGMLTDAQLGWFIQKGNVGRLRKLRDRLSKDALAAALRDLESLDRRRVPVDAVVARWERWYRGAFNAFQRATLGWSGTEATERVNQRVQAKKARDLSARDLRFLLVELAIHAYHEDKGTWPRSASDLVPAYLASAPIDPATDKAIDYPANARGELTDDLGSIARPDGEVAPRP